MFKLKQVVQISLQTRTISALCSKGELETCPDVVTCMLKVFSIYVYALLDLGSTLSFVTPLVAK